MWKRTEYQRESTKKDCNNCKIYLLVKRALIIILLSETTRRL